MSLDKELDQCRETLHLKEVELSECNFLLQNSKEENKKLRKQFERKSIQYETDIETLKSENKKLKQQLENARKKIEDDEEDRHQGLDLDHGLDLDLAMDIRDINSISGSDSGINGLHHHFQLSDASVIQKNYKQLTLKEAFQKKVDEKLDPAELLDFKLENPESIFIEKSVIGIETDDNRIAKSSSSRPPPPNNLLPEIPSPIRRRIKSLTSLTNFLPEYHGKSLSTPPIESLDDLSLRNNESDKRRDDFELFDADHKDSDSEDKLTKVPLNLNTDKTTLVSDKTRKKSISSSIAQARQIDSKTTYDSSSSAGFNYKDGISVLSSDSSRPEDFRKTDRGQSRISGSFFTTRSSASVIPL